LVAESLKVNVAVRVPAAVGLNTIEAAQVAEALRVAPQESLEIVKSAASAPDTAMLVMVIDEVSPLVSVTDWDVLVEPTAVLANERLVGVAETLPGALVPIPERVVVCVPAESLKLRMAVRVPVVFGAKSTFTVQLVDAARLVPQVLLAIS
jgi:hypothetical protein